MTNNTSSSQSQTNKILRFFIIATAIVIAAATVFIGIRVFAPATSTSKSSSSSSQSDAENKENNTTSSSISSSPFVADSINDVMVFENCDLAIKHPKSILYKDSSLPVTYNKRNITGVEDKTRLTLSANSSEQSSIASMNLGCTPVQQSASLADYLATQNLTNPTTLNKSDFCSKFSFTAQSCELLMSEIVKDVSVLPVDTTVTTYYFQFNSNNYIFIGDVSPELSPIQIQFNSLAPSIQTSTQQDVSNF